MAYGSYINKHIHYCIAFYNFFDIHLDKEDDKIK